MAALLKKKISNRVPLPVSYGPVPRTSELSLLWIFPADPVLQELSEWLFAHPDSPLSPHRDFDRIHSPLLTVPAFRRAVMSALQDASAAAWATRYENRMLLVEDKTTAWFAFAPPRDKEVQPGVRTPVRVKDVVAWQLSKIAGFPPFQPDWPESHKDYAAASVARFLLRHGTKLHAFPGRLQDMICNEEWVRLSPRR